MDEIDCIQIEIIELQEKITQLRALLEYKLASLEKQAADAKLAQESLKSS